MKKVCYVVWVGRQTGVFGTWNETEVHVKGFKGAKFKGFSDDTTAQEAFKKPWQDFIDFTRKPKDVIESDTPPEAAHPRVEDIVNYEYPDILAPGELPF